MQGPSTQPTSMHGPIPNTSVSNTVSTGPASTTTKPTKKKKAPRKKKHTTKHALSSSSPTGNSALGPLGVATGDGVSTHTASSFAAARIASIREERDAIPNDPAWITPSFDYKFPMEYGPTFCIDEGIERGEGILNCIPGKHLFPPVGDGGLLSMEQELNLVDAALRANGLCRDDLDFETIECVLEEARRYVGFIVTLVSGVAVFAFYCHDHT